MPNLRRSFKAGPKRLAALTGAADLPRNAPPEADDTVNSAFPVNDPESEVGWQEEPYTGEGAASGPSQCFAAEELKTAPALRGDLQRADSQAFSRGVTRLADESAWRIALGALTSLRDRRWLPESRDGRYSWRPSTVKYIICWMRSRAGRTRREGTPSSKGLLRLIDLFQGNDPDEEIRRLKSQDEGF